MLSGLKVRFKDPVLSGLKVRFKDPVLSGLKVRHTNNSFLILSLISHFVTHFSFALNKHFIHLLSKGSVQKSGLNSSDNH